MDPDTKKEIIRLHGALSDFEIILQFLGIPAWIDWKEDRACIIRIQAIIERLIADDRDKKKQQKLV